MSLSRQIFCFTLLFLSSIAYAATDTFTINTFVGDDVTPPSIPTSLVATPIASSQINLSWASSTDNYILSGYYVYRDDVQIATTTNTSYADVGLFASTTYTYYVTAFDYFNNVSASSSLVSTSTFATPTPPVESEDDGGSRQGSKAHLSDLKSLEILPSQYGAIIRYETGGYVRSVVQWGTTISYEAGSSAERSFAKFHEIHIEDLKPGTRYQFIIHAETQGGQEGILTETSFVTLPVEDSIPAGNVTRLKAIERGGDVILTWENPTDSDFDHVRVMRSDSFYPNDLADGWVVYEGAGRLGVDADALTQHERLYYTVFTIDREGNVSSGAVVAIGRTEMPPIGDPSQNEINLRFDQIEFYQDGARIFLEKDQSLLINGGHYLTIAIPYALLPLHLKTILVTLVKEDDPESSFTFLLRINKEKTAYTARIAPFGVEDAFNLRTSIFDYKTAQVGFAEGTIRSVINTYGEEESESYLIGLLRRITGFIGDNYVLLFSILLILLALCARRLIQVRE